MKKSIAFVALAAVSLALTACASQPDAQVEKKADTSVEESASAEATEEWADTAGAAVEGELLQPGQTVALGDWATYEYVDYDDKTAVLNTKLVSIEPATAEQTATLVEEIPELKGWKVSLIRYQQQKVSGDDITFGANYTDFTPADATGAKAQEVSVIGWDECASESFTEEFNAGTAVLDQCMVGASVEGGELVGGMLWTGNSSADENPFSDYEGEPVFFKN